MLSMTPNARTAVDHSLMVSAAGLDSGGNSNNTTIKQTQDTATTPIGMYHRPRVNGPGTSLSRPEVMRRKMGVTYEVYKPITAELVDWISPTR